MKVSVENKEEILYQGLKMCCISSPRFPDSAAAATVMVRLEQQPEK